MSEQQNKGCELCTADDAAERKGCGSMPLCSACDTWISDQMRPMNVILPDEFGSADEQKITDEEIGESLAVDPSLATEEALAYTQISSRAVACLEVAGYMTAGDLWEATIQELSNVRTMDERSARRIMKSISKSDSHSDNTSLGDLFG